VLDWTEATLARVERAAFFQRFALGEAVQYFYEPFLAEFDTELRKQFGVWYTPPEIVKYMVARVDRAFRSEEVPIVHIDRDKASRYCSVCPSPNSLR
jgi:hypothetical protein